jgi:hypothetical protein
MASILYIADKSIPSFQTARLSADVVCAGDSITGWNYFYDFRSGFSGAQGCSTDGRI